MGKEIKLEVKVNNNSYPLIVNDSEEKIILQSIEELNNSIFHIKSIYKNISEEDALAMCCINYAISYSKEKIDNISGNENVKDKIKQISAILDSAVS